MAEAVLRDPRRSLTIAPHIGVHGSSVGATWTVAFALLPITGWGIAVFGAAAALVLAASVGAAVVAEVIVTVPFGRFTLPDGSAFVTGLLIGLLMPAGVPLYVPAAASAFAMIVVKHSFGGLGRNWMNPALGGGLFALLSWGDRMSTWTPPLGNPSALTPPLQALQRALSARPQPGSALSILSANGYPTSAVDASVVGWLNAHVFSPVGIPLPSGTFDVSIGLVPGSIGTVSAPLLILGGAILFSRRVLRWELSLSYLGVFTVLALIFGGLSAGRGWFAGTPAFNLFSGGVLLGGFFLVADPVTSPLTRRGRWIYGVGLGALTFLLRYFGSLGDGVVASIALGNAFVPLLDKLTRRRTPAARKESGS